MVERGGKEKLRGLLSVMYIVARERAAIDENHRGAVFLVATRQLGLAAPFRPCQRKERKRKKRALGPSTTKEAGIN